MISNTFPYRLYLVTDEKACLSRDLIKVTEAAVKGGVDIVQLREKELNEKDFLKKALRLKEMLDRYHVPLIINDNLKVTQGCQAAGIHVGRSDTSPTSIRKNCKENYLIGYSIEEESQLQNEDTTTSDYLAISPVFSTPTKTNTITEWGLEGIRKIRSLSSKPLVAIGGIHQQNAAAIIRAGADCLAVVSAICSAVDPALAAEALRIEIEKAVKAK
jgi:thiamine-phosphate pyrophosphorylase